MIGAGGCGHYEYLTERNARVLAANAGRMSAAARSTKFPQVYARPVPVSDPHKELKAEIESLKKRNAQLMAENDRLKAENAALSKPSKVADITAVMVAFRETLEALGHQIEGRAYTVVDLKSPRRARAYVWPRHICMWLCRRICRDSSLPVIGRCFGQRDHTSVMHGCAHAPAVMEASPILRAAAVAVLARFDET